MTETTLRHQASQADTNLHGERRWARRTFLVLLWALMAGFALQILFVGLGFFYQGAFLATHVGFGWLLAHLIAPLVFILGFFARLGRRLNVLAAATLILIVLLPILATMRGDLGILGAFHPLAAVAAVLLTLQTIQSVRALLLSSRVTARIPHPTRATGGTVASAPASLNPEV